MIISIHAIPGEPLKIQPDPAIAHVGDSVVWEVFFDSHWHNFRHPILWTIYFEDKNPFTARRESQLSQKSEPDKKVKIDGGTAQAPGDYKYGVRIINAETNKTISDDDPKLIVLSREKQPLPEPNLQAVLASWRDLLTNR